VIFLHAEPGRLRPAPARDGTGYQGSGPSVGARSGMSEQHNAAVRCDLAGFEAAETFL
jgi:hypothetical protein